MLSGASRETTGELMRGHLPRKSRKVDRSVFHTQKSSLKMLKAWSVKNDKVGMLLIATRGALGTVA